jgi:hypothetical protein
MKRFILGLILAASPLVAEAAGPNPICFWYATSTATQNVFYNAWGITGYERGFVIRSGNYDTTNNRIDYTIRYLADPLDCSGEEFIVRFPMHGLDDHVEIEVLETDEDPLGRLEADRGELPVIFDQDDIALSPGTLGPLVITDGMMGQVDRILLFVFLDAVTLNELPEPAFINGSPPSNFLQELLMGLAYNFAIGQRAELYDLFHFRRLLPHMTNAAIDRAADAVDDAQYDANIKGGGSGTWFWEDHDSATIIHHMAISPETGSAWGGFFNGHRNYMLAMENYFVAHGASMRTPFRRIPAWNSFQTIPSAFDVEIDDTTPNVAMPNDIKAANICEAYNPGLSAEPFLEDALVDIEDQMFDDHMDSTGTRWHNDTHVAGGGLFGGPFATAAKAPIFFPWHTSIDSVWRNWQLCWPAWDPDLYSW